MKKLLAGLGGAAAMAAIPAMALAQAAAPSHGPVDGHIGLVPAGSALADEVHFFHNVVLMPIITIISVLVLALLIWIVIRFNSKANPTPRKFSHNTLIEVVWTVIPIFILLAIALPSFDLLYKEDVIPDGKQVVVAGDGAKTEFVFDNDFPASRMVKRDQHLQVFLASAAGEERLKKGDDYEIDGLGDPAVRVTLNDAPSRSERVVIRGGRSLVGPSGFMGLGADKREIALAPTMTLKVNGFQWGWTYSYPDFGDFEFTATPLSREEAGPEAYHWAVNNPVVVPVGETVRVTTTARDVIHSWAMPNFAIKVDAVPGRINETWFNAVSVGTYYGQCSEICGIRHSFMPIEVHVVARPEFEAWVDSQRALAGLDPMYADATKLAQAPNDQKEGL